MLYFRISNINLRRKMTTINPKLYHEHNIVWFDGEVCIINYY